MKTLLTLLLLIPSLSWGNHERENKWDEDIGDFVPIENKCSYDDNKEDYFNYLKEIHSCDAQTGFLSASDHYVRYTDFFEVLSSLMVFVKNCLIDRLINFSDFIIFFIILCCLPWFFLI